MTEYYRIFDNQTITEAQLAEFFHKIMAKDGVLANLGDSMLAVIQATPAAMSVVVGTGDAWIQGAWYQNSAAKTLTVTTAHASLSRIDRVVLRLDWAANTIGVVMLDGTAGSGIPTPLTQNSSTWEISLAKVTVAGGATSILTANITDERYTTYCGIAASNLGFGYQKYDGSYEMGSRQLHNVTDPTSAQDAATKAYADTKASLASPAFTGNPTAPLQATGNSSTRLATTSFVQQELGTWAAFTPTLTWGGSAPTLTLPTVARKLTVGKIVYIQIYIYVGASATKGTSLVITGLPGTLVTTMAYTPLSALEQYYNSGALYADPQAYIDTADSGSIKFRGFRANVGAGDQVLTMMVQGFYEVS